jgi:nitroreductase
MDILQVIKDRRSVRAFRPDPVPDEHLETMLDAARYAPTAGNRQPWCFLVVRERANLERLRPKLEQHMRERIEATEEEPTAQIERLHAASVYVEEIFAAPLFIFIFVDTSAYPELVAYDGALAAGNLMLAARALGYATCFQTTFFPEEVVHDHFGVPRRFRFICAVPVGRPVEWPPTPPKKPLTELVRYERM